MLVEVCCNSLESALNAEKGGADRIELCSELGVGGITPSYGLVTLVKEQLSIPVHVLIRPRSAHFTYTQTELDVILKDIEFCRDIGVQGIVSGALNEDHTLNVEMTKKIIDHAKPLHFTFHRAFDWLPNTVSALPKLVELGVNTILTSGSSSNAEAGMASLKKLLALELPVTIMPGAGVNADNVKLFKEAGFKAVHFSGTAFENEVLLVQKISMNSSKHLAEKHIAVTNEEIVRRMVKIVK